MIDATGTYATPNRLGDGGLDALGERACAPRILRAIPRAEELAGQTVLLTGGGHCAQTAARDLAEVARRAPGTRVVWVVRAPAPTWGAVKDDPLPQRAALNAVARELAAGACDAVQVRPGHVVEALRPRDGGLAVTLRNGGP